MRGADGAGGRFDGMVGADTTGASDRCRGGYGSLQARRVAVSGFADLPGEDSRPISRLSRVRCAAQCQV